MSFDNFYPNRKDKRKPYRNSRAFDRTCRNRGSCKWCERNRTISNIKRKLYANQDLRLFSRDLDERYIETQSPMNVKQLKQFLNQFPENAVVLLSNVDGTYVSPSITFQTAILQDGTWKEDRGEDLTTDSERRTAIVISP